MILFCLSLILISQVLQNSIHAYTVHKDSFAGGNLSDDDKTRPNFIFILTDDQDRLLGKDGYSPLGSLEIMPNLQQKLMQEGAVVDHFLVNTPICCPSRTEYFSGRYFHNVRKDHGGCMHADTDFISNNKTGLFGLLKQNGYNVGLFGKITNNQEEMLGQLSGNGNTDYIDSPLQ